MEELIQKIILKAYEITQNTKHCVFAYYYGHVNQLDVRTYLNGWTKTIETNYDVNIDLDSKNAKEKLKECLQKLEKLEEE